MQIAMLIISIFILIITILIFFRINSFTQQNSNENTDKLIDEIKSCSQNSNREIKEELNNSIHFSIKNLTEVFSVNQKNSSDSMNEQLKLLEKRFQTLEANNELKLEAIRTTMTKHLTGIQEENSKKLDAIQTTVNEKLENKMNESFKLVGERLEQVYKGLGEMQNIAAGVGDLKKVLSNVKNRGILGEVQLGAILEDILAPEQYDREIPTIPGSANRVEFAVKLPGAENGKFVYLPIDSKFPGDTFAVLQDAYNSGDTEKISAAKKTLQTVVKKCAKDIKDKYVEPPYTTNFGIMFLPFEGLYSEIVNSGMIETLQKEYNVNVTGPSTMAAMLNSLQMGFRTLAIQKRSSEVWEVLGSVKSEFQTFAKVLEDTQKHIKKVDDDLDKLVGVRTRQINRKLSAVECPSLTDNIYDSED